MSPPVPFVVPAQNKKKQEVGECQQLKKNAIHIHICKYICAAAYIHLEDYIRAHLVC